MSLTTGGMYYRTCENCGGRYHLNEGGCGCYEEQEEQRQEELLERLESCTIEDVETSQDNYRSTCDWSGETIHAGEVEIRLYIKEKDGEDEICLTPESYDEIRGLLKRDLKPTR